MQPNLDPRAGAFVARQPILDAAGDVFGYELLYRTSERDRAPAPHDDVSTARVISDAVLTLGLDVLTAGRWAFIKLTRPLLLADYAAVLPPSSVAIEVSDKVGIDGAIIETCRGLCGRGYTLAIDEFSLTSDARALLPFARFVKMDVSSTGRADGHVIHQALPRDVRVIASRVDCRRQFEEARRDGHTLFQGRYFCEPSILGRKQISPRRLAYAQLLAELNRPDVSIDRVEALVTHDLSLSVQILRSVNSAAFGVRHEVQSIRQALMLLGLDIVRRWASVWALAGLSAGRGSELVATAILRARTCEAIAAATACDDPGEYFLLGLCSLLDVMLGEPMAAVLDGLPLRAHVRYALMGESNKTSRVLDAVTAYERGAWEESASHLEALGANVDTLGIAYAAALRWARELSPQQAVA